MTDFKDKIIQLAWHDKTSFDEIKKRFQVSEKEVIKIMRTYLKPKSFKLWRKRVNGRLSKHQKKYKSIYLEENCKIKINEIH